MSTQESNWTFTRAPFASALNRPSTDALTLLSRWRGARVNRFFNVLHDQDEQSGGKDWLAATLKTTPEDTAEAARHLDDLCRELGLERAPTTPEDITSNQESMSAQARAA